jgi:orotidine-5'-phosphate decarboxylase
MPNTDSKVIVALDFADADKARKFVQGLTPDLCKLKIGKELFTSAGPDLVREFVDQEFNVFLDLKFHDIPNTVNKAVSAACKLGVWMLNVHALGGKNMMSAANQAIEDFASDRKPILIAVSILTSTSPQGLSELGIDKTLEQSVLDLTGMALDSGLDGMVCSAQEVAMLRKAYGDVPILVTPGIRPTGLRNDDQQRIMTPEQAILAGSSYLVIGRPVTQSPDPVKTLRQINTSLEHL